VLPTRAKALGIELPRTGDWLAGLAKRLTSHLAVGRKSHFELVASQCGGNERLAIEEGRLDVGGRHRLPGNSSAYCDE
jgi:hypothetical protein